MTHRARAGLVALVAALALAACGGGGEAKGDGTPTAGRTTPGATTPAGSFGTSVEVIDSAFSPASLTVAVGTEVVWNQTGIQMHTVTAQDNSFDSNPQCPADVRACMKAGDHFTHRFAQAGTVRYFCKVHGESMSGTIVVQ